jgi:hypothetical protein
MRNKLQRHTRTKPVHVLALLRSVIECKQMTSWDGLGISPATCAHIENGDLLPLSKTLAERIAFHTGISIQWLLRNDSKAPMVTMDGKKYSKEFYDRIQWQRKESLVPVKSAGDECFRHYLRLCVKMGRVLLAAASAKDAKFAAWKIRNKLIEIGKEYKAFGGDEIEGSTVKNPTKPELFEDEMRSLMNTGPKSDKVWRAIITTFNRELIDIQNQHVTASLKIKRVRHPVQRKNELNQA